MGGLSRAPGGWHSRCVPAGGVNLEQSAIDLESADRRALLRRVRSVAATVPAAAAPVLEQVTR